MDHFYLPHDINFAKVLSHGVVLNYYLATFFRIGQIDYFLDIGIIYGFSKLQATTADDSCE